jgi:hypothetical protein
MGPEIVNMGQHHLWNPEAVSMGQFLGPETDTFFHFLVPIVFFPEFRPIEKEKNNLNML